MIKTGHRLLPLPAICADKITVFLCPGAWWDPAISTIWLGSSPVVGSSRIKISGSWIMACARPTRWRKPFESSPIFLCFSIFRPQTLIICRTCSLILSSERPATPHNMPDNRRQASHGIGLCSGKTRWIFSGFDLYGLSSNRISPSSSDRYWWSFSWLWFFLLLGLKTKDFTPVFTRRIWSQPLLRAIEFGQTLHLNIHYFRNF